jgi:phospholipid/cholesterol/gamma-HCH transport system substrate-binding protein
MEKKSIIKTGVLVILALVLLVWGLSFLKGENLFKTENEYVAVYDRLDRLAESNQVLLGGYRIGTVKSIEFKEIDNELKIYVRIRVSNDFKIPKGTVLKIVSVDIMGTRGIDVVRPKNFSGYHVSGDTLRGAVEGGIIEQFTEMVMPLKDDLIGMLFTTDSVMHAVNRLLNEQNISYITSGLEDLQRITANLSAKMPLVDSMLVNFDKLGKTLAKNDKNIDRAVSNFAALSDTLSALELSKTLTEARTALNCVNEMLNTVNNGDGTVQRFLSSDSVYNNIETLTAKLNTLLADFEKHPKKYVNLSIFGGKEKEKKK